MLRLAKTATPLRFTWTWPHLDVAVLDPAMVIVAREPDGRWYVTFTVDAAAPEPLPAAGRENHGQRSWHLRQVISRMRAERRAGSSWQPRRRLVWGWWH